MYVPAFMCYKENFNLLWISFLYECMYPVQLKCCNTRAILEYHVQCKMNAKLQMHKANQRSLLRAKYFNQPIILLRSFI